MTTNAHRMFILLALLWLSLPVLAAPAVDVEDIAVDVEDMLISSAHADRIPHGPVVADAHGDAVLRLQVLLGRSHFSPGEIDGVFGSNVAKALVGFQLSRGLDGNGELDAATWIELERDDVPVLVLYTITAADIEGPYYDLPEEPIDKSELPALGFASVAEALGERFHASPGLLQSLNPDSNLDQEGETIRVPNVLGVAALAPASKVVVTESNLTVTLFDADDQVIAQFPASTGSSRDPLPIGDWVVTGVALDPIYNYDPDLFWNSEPSRVKATLQPGPNNPVGTVWIGLSKPHYGIHGTPDPSLIGKTHSAGCIRLTNWDALLVANAVTANTPVILVE